MTTVLDPTAAQASDGARAATSRIVPPFRVPPEREPPILSYLGALRTNALVGWPRRTYDDLITRRSLLGRSSFTLSDPDAIRRVLVDNQANYARTAGSVRILRPILGDGVLISEGASWRHQRRSLAPAFTPKAIDGLVPLIDRAIGDALGEFDVAAARGPVALFAALHRLALEIAGRSMFSVAMDRHGDALRGFIAEYSERLGRPHLLDILMPPTWRAPLDFPRARFRKRWTPFLGQIIEARAADGTPRTHRDLLDLLMAARNPETGAAFSYAEVRDQVATMILAGHETTAVLLFWAAYMLALAPELQEQVAREVQGADLAAPAGCAQDGRLPLTRAVIDETMRLYPPAFVIVRRALEADRVAGVEIAAGDIVMISPWVLHRHRRVWDDPHAFDPGRFLPGAPAIPRYAYLPFGVGPRVCIGAHFALTEAVLALARIVGRFRISLADGRPVLPAAVVTTQPEHAPDFHLVPR
ncbi:cytochrome P450 [Methylobacterium sp. E-016]|uniref:cytochrome P450 n=1 Tax=Methylobacterium sp. E-016 TaxID=2836556 RepID=UPI001FB89F7D|nr:cytochrome P450 [Methylobacterium sp. E-016]MCJ2079316.1 cytochrome P450 [Methylobacterium sp. E-016]